MILKKHFLILAASFVTTGVAAQVPEDALRMSWNPIRGTARNMSIGGVMGSLGGDIQATFVNPAGLGMFKTNEFVLSPGWSLYNSRGEFRGTDAKSDKNNFNFGTTGFVFGYNTPYNKWTNKAISIAINRTADFNNSVLYRGLNDFSSFSEQFAEEFANSGLPLDIGLPHSKLSFPTSLALYTYLIDTTTIDGRIEVVGLPQRNAWLAGQNALLNQENEIITSGGITEVALGFASNMDDRLYLGASLGIPIVNYKRTSTFTESDATGNADNNFNFASYREEMTSKGIGVNARLGMIYKPAEKWRVGVALHTPTFYSLKENTYGKMVVDVENYFGPGNGLDSADTKTLYSNGAPDVTYNLSSPWKAVLGGSYVISEVEDTRMQKAFISADIEYVTYGSPRFANSDLNYSSDYYSEVNSVVKDIYKGALNFRVGGELKFHTIMARAGFAYYGNPYRDEALKGNRMNISGGLGYRDHGIFIDLTYVHSVSKDVHFPYRLSDKANTFADLKGNTGNIMLSFGIKF
ncbi:MAG TPA: hypothetical protein VIK74_10675 [Parasegetibacter sp.]